MPVTSKTQTLSKLGADLRWYLEQRGVDPELSACVITVKSTIAQSKLIEGFLHDFDGTTMRRDDQWPHRIVVHGIPIWVMVEQLIKPTEAA